MLGRESDQKSIDGLKKSILLLEGIHTSAVNTFVMNGISDVERLEKAPYSIGAR